MKKSSGIVRLICIFAVSLALVCYNFYTYALKGTNRTFPTVDDAVNTEEVQSYKEISEENIVSKPESSKENSSSASSSETSSVPVATKGNVKGKIISKYISPYSAGVSYNNVYLKNSTDLSIDIKSLLSSPLSFTIKSNDQPQVLIMHTHTTETYMSEDSDYYTDAFSSRTRDKDKNMVSVGEIIAKKLNAAGIKTIHDKTEHDYPKYTGSYTRAAKTITSTLKKYPSIKVVLDLHRDAVTQGENDKVKLVTEINGKKAAQVMLVMGSQSGGVTNFPNWKENLKLAVRLQQTIEVKYPTLARPIMLMPNNYNESLSKGSLLIEFGTDANTVAEAQYSAELVGDSLVSLLNTLK